jgi:hypothetical protein
MPHNARGPRDQCRSDRLWTIPVSRTRGRPCGHLPQAQLDWGDPQTSPWDSVQFWLRSDSRHDQQITSGNDGDGFRHDSTRPPEVATAPSNDHFT